MAGKKKGKGKNKGPSKRKKVMGTMGGISTILSCFIGLVVVAGFLFGTNIMGNLYGPGDPANDTGDGDEITLPTNNTVTDPTTTVTDPNIDLDQYMYEWGFTWDPLLDVSAKCAITITLRQALAPYTVYGAHILGEEVGDAALVFYPSGIVLNEGIMLDVIISNSEGYEFIIGGFTLSSHQNSVGPTSVSYYFGHDGVAAPIVDGTFYSTWALV